MLQFAVKFTPVKKPFELMNYGRNSRTDKTTHNPRKKM